MHIYVFTGAALFEGQTTEVAIELDITSNRNELGEFTGNRTPFDNSLGSSEGKGRLWCDMVWNEEKKEYEEAVCFRWVDEQQGVMTVLEFNSACDNLDVKHSFYEGIIMRFPAFADPNDSDLENVTQHGTFDFLCSSKIMIGCMPTKKVEMTKIKKNPDSFRECLIILKKLKNREQKKNATLYDYQKVMTGLLICLENNTVSMVPKTANLCNLRPLTLI
ncbi:hypothetical protein RFI_12812 [Reticulomyxa filosa]|uniref:Uncharacterized protein n=1 Tax=Reticulomyxa filosa TaxID=46433 RepID=X6NEM0_RETFI|nr:hypothetical protein RFI_12812 [Reticulomyxa filosa]|eukprot:ETO24343.1 hypothetical protein RFI_12812 [Reticulomyxa filosa]